MTLDQSVHQPEGVCVCVCVCMQNRAPNPANKSKQNERFDLEISFPFYNHSFQIPSTIMNSNFAFTDPRNLPEMTPLPASQNYNRPFPSSQQRPLHPSLQPRTSNSPYLEHVPGALSFSTPRFPARDATTGKEASQQQQQQQTANSFSSPVDRFNRSTLGPSNLRYSVTNNDENHGETSTGHYPTLATGPSSKTPFDAARRSVPMTNTRPGTRNIYNRTGNSYNRDNSVLYTPMPTKNHVPSYGNPQLRSARKDAGPDFEIGALHESLRRRVDPSNDNNATGVATSATTQKLDAQVLSLLNRLKAVDEEISQQKLALKELSGSMSSLEAREPEMKIELSRLNDEIDRQARRFQ